MITAVTGINWGDEGKGRIVDLLSEKADYVVRYQGGNNAGHTVVTPEGKYVLNLIPSGILHPEAVCVLGGGMVVDLDHLRHEMSMLQYMKVKVDSDNLRISDKATICMPFHVRQDVLEEERLLEKGAAFGSTRRGIAYAYGDKYMKKTLRMGDLLNLNSIAIKRRLQVILESKNLIMEMSMDRIRFRLMNYITGVKVRLNISVTISVIPESCLTMLPRQEKIFFLKHSLAL